MTPESHYRDSGYWLAREVVPSSKASEILKLAQLRDHPERFITRDAGGQRVRVEGAHQLLGDAAPYATPGNLRDAISLLLGARWCALLNRHNHVVIDRGAGKSADRLHRDCLHWTRRYVTCVVMLAAAVDAASWSRVLPGSQRWPIDGPRNVGGYWLDEGPYAELAAQAVFVSMRPGDALFMDPLMFHASGAGTATLPRATLTLALAASDELAREPAPNEVELGAARIYAGQQSWR